MAQEKVLSLPPDQQTTTNGQLTTENKNGKQNYNIFELLWFAISYKYGKWFAPVEILEVKNELTEKEITDFLLEAAKHGFFETFCDGTKYEFRTTVIWENCNVPKTLIVVPALISPFPEKIYHISFLTVLPCSKSTSELPIA